MNESRYVRYDKRRLPRQKRTIPIFGAASYVDGRVVKDQSNVFYRCWNCGFPCRTDRDKLGDGEGFVVKDHADVLEGYVPGTAYTPLGPVGSPTEGQDTLPPTAPAYPEYGVLNLGASAHEFPGSDNGMDIRLAIEDNMTIHLMRLDAIGNPVTVMHNYYSKHTGGCPLCHTKQYK